MKSQNYLQQILRRHTFTGFQ
uniref:Uncharacterized protein n=1 Tax=Arundo donax TaxID=35708 RepID=A0A0A9GIT3_ARUDO